MKFFLLIYNCWLLWRNVNGNLNEEEYSSSEELENRIAGGVATSLSSFPFNIQFFNKGGMCGGSILTKKTVLTAAHCFDNNKIVEEMAVFSSSRFIHDLKSFNHAVWGFKIHEKYNQRTFFSNDIAVVMIVDDFVLTDMVKIVSLCSSEVWMKENETFYVSGWGETKYGEGVANQQLKMTYMNYVPKDRCEAKTGVKLTSDMFCLFGDGERDTCRGDSGGGVMWNNMLVGVVSHGEGCVKKPSMYVNVSRMRPWIQTVVHNLYHKFCLENGTSSSRPVATGLKFLAG